MSNPKMNKIDGIKLAVVAVDETPIPLSFHGDLTPVEVVGQFLRDLAALRVAEGYGYDELIDIAQQLDGGDGS